MISELLYKWFGIDPRPCEACEILRMQLLKSDAERRELLMRILDKDKPEPLLKETEEMKPIQSQFIPWSVRRQMLEAEDRKTAELMRAKQAEMKYSTPKTVPRVEEIEKLESELGISKSLGQDFVGGAYATEK